MPHNNKLVVVDTNCLLRLYISPVRPLLGRTVAKYQLMTLSELARELKGLAKSERHAWLSDPAILSDVDSACLNLTRVQQKSIQALVPALRKAGQTFLRKYCEKKKTRLVRNLSEADALALVASIELEAALATDEWPLRLFSAEVDADDNGGRVELLTSVELLHLVETHGLTTRDERIKTYRDWIRYDELCGDAPKLYLKLFGEGPPTAQG